MTSNKPNIIIFRDVNSGKIKWNSVYHHKFIEWFEKCCDEVQQGFLKAYSEADREKAKIFYKRYIQGGK